MPKRRITMARLAAIAKWQIAGAKARKKKTNTIVTYHHTTARAAQLITSPPTKIRRGGFMRNTRVWTTNNKSKKSNVAYRGSTVLAITTKKQSLYKENTFPNKERDCSKIGENKTSGYCCED